MFFKDSIFDIIYFTKFSPILTFLYFFLITLLFLFPLFLLLDKFLLIISSTFSRINPIINLDKLEEIIDYNSIKKMDILNNNLWIIGYKKKKKYNKSIFFNNIADLLITKPIIWIYFLFISNIFFFLYIFHELIVWNFPIFYLLLLIILNLSNSYIENKFKEKNS